MVNIMSSTEKQIKVAGYRIEHELPKIMVEMHATGQMSMGI